MFLGEALAGHDQCGRAVGGGADVQQPQRVGDDGAGQDVLDGGFLAVAGVGVVEAVARVFDLDLGKIVQRGAVEVHAPACEQGEVDGVGGPDQVEALPVGVVAAFPADGGEEAFGGGVGADDQRDVAEAGQDLGARALQSLRSAGARGVAGGDRDPVPAQLLGKGRARYETGIAVADGVRAGNELDLAPVQAGLGQRGAGGDDAVLGEVASPFAPRVHARTQDVHRFGSCHRAILQA